MPKNTKTFSRIEKNQKRVDGRMLQPRELRVLFSADETADGPDECIHMYRFQVLTGLRGGELIGLQWDDIRDGTATIQRSIDLCGEVTPPESNAVQRSIVLPKRALAEIEAQRELMDALGVRSDFVFPDASTGEPMRRAEYNKRFWIYCRRNGLHHSTPNELRYTWIDMNNTLPREWVAQTAGIVPASDNHSAQIASMLDRVMDRVLN